MSDEWTVEILIRDKATGEALWQIDGLAASQRHIVWETDYAAPPEGLFDLDTNRRALIGTPPQVERLHLSTFAPKPVEGILYTVHDLTKRPPDVG